MQQQRLAEHRPNILASSVKRCHRMASRRLSFAALVASALLGGGVQTLDFATPARAQQQEFFLNVAPVMLAEPASKSPLPIQVGPPDALMRNTATTSLEAAFLDIINNTQSAHVAVA